MTTFGLVLDCRDPSTLADFWAAALGYVNLGAAGNYVLLVAEDGIGPKLLLQRVPEAKSGQEPHAPRHRHPWHRSRSGPPRATAEFES
jgi:hypothetical protein